MTKKKVKMRVLGLKNQQDEIYEQRKYLANADHVFRGHSLDRCHVSFDLKTQKDVGQAIKALQALSPCFTFKSQPKNGDQ